MIQEAGGTLGQLQVGIRGNTPKSVRVTTIVRQMEERHTFLGWHKAVGGGFVREILEVSLWK